MQPALISKQEARPDVTVGRPWSDKAAFEPTYFLRSPHSILVVKYKINLDSSIWMVDLGGMKRDRNNNKGVLVPPFKLTLSSNGPCGRPPFPFSTLHHSTATQSCAPTFTMARKTSVFLYLALLAHQVTATPYPALQWDPETAKDCVGWYNNFDNSTCEYIRSAFTITPEQFHEWNPSPGLDCSGWHNMQSYCIVTQGRLETEPPRWILLRLHYRYASPLQQLALLPSSPPLPPGPT
jgi:hypothetical protein